MSSPFSALKNPNYRLYFAGQFGSMTGTWMQATVQSWLVYQLSHSALWLGVIAFCFQLPAFFSSPFAGVSADRFDRKRTLLLVAWFGMAQALLLGLLTLTGWVALWHIAILAVMLGLTSAFDMTTRHAFAVDLVGKTDLPSAIACNSIIINGSRILGPALAGLLLPLVGEGICFILNALSFIAVLYSLRKIRVTSNSLASHRTGDQPRTSVGTELTQTFSYLRRTPEISRLLWISGFMSLIGFPYMVLLPVFAKSVLGGDARTLAWLTGMGGLGAIFGALGRATKDSAGPDLEKRIPLYFVGIGFGLFLLGSAKTFLLALLAIFLLGYLFMGTFPAINTAIQSRVDDSLRGKVLAFYTMTFMGAAPVGSFASGWLADRVGAPAVEFGAAALFLLAGGALSLLYPVCNIRPKWLRFRA